MDYLHIVNILSVLNISIKPQNPYYLSRFSSLISYGNTKVLEHLANLTARKHFSPDSGSSPAFEYTFTLRRIVKPCNFMSLI